MAQTERGFYVGARQAFVHDSNLFREASGTSDMRSDTSLLGGLERNFGLQRAYADAYVRASRFQDVSRLNHNAFGALVGLDWSGYERISGTVQLGYDRSLADYGTAGTPVTTERNLESARFASASARYALTQQLAAVGRLERREVSYSADAFRDSEYRQNIGELGVSYGHSGVLTLGAGVRQTNGRVPRYLEASPGVFLADRSRRRDLEVSATWVPSAISTITSRLAYSRQRNSEASNSEFSGAPGSIEWAYAPTGRLQLTTAVSRDTGSERRFEDFSVTTPVVATEFSSLVTTYSIQAAYDLTGRIDLTTGYRLSNGSFSDRTREFTLGATYQATRTIDLGCDLSRLSQSGPSRYSANVVGCYAQILLP